MYCFFDFCIDHFTRLLVRGECTVLDKSGRGAPLAWKETCAGNIWSTTMTWKTHNTTDQETYAVLKGIKRLGDDLLQGNRGKSIKNGPQWWVGLNCSEQMVQNLNALYLVPPTVPPQSKNWFCQFLQMPHSNNPTKPICHEIHPRVRTEVQKGILLHRVLTTTSCHWSQNGGPGPKLQ